jgi:hypothetical protein
MERSKKGNHDANTNVYKIRNVGYGSSLYLLMCCYESREHVMKGTAATVAWSIVLKGIPQLPQ